MSIQRIDVVEFHQATSDYRLRVADDGKIVLQRAWVGWRSGMVEWRNVETVQGRGD